MPSNNQIPSIHRDVLHKTMPDGTLLVLKGGEFFKIDGASVDLFLAVDGKKTMSKVFASVAEKHGVTESNIRTKSAPVVAKLIAFGVLGF